MRVTNLRCEYAVNPLGLDTPSPRLSWALVDERRGARQVACQILVASRADKLAAGDGDMWDTGKIITDASLQHAYAGTPLVARQRAYWKVRVWDETGVVSDSEPACWEMGLLAPADWQAQWIGVPVEKTVDHSLDGACWIWGPWLPAESGQCIARTTFTIPDAAAVTAATLFARISNTGTLSLNDHELGVANNWRNLGVYDALAAVRSGENTLTISAKGWDGAPGLICKLLLTQRDGAIITITSDAMWSTQPAPDAAWQSAVSIAPYGSGPWEIPAETPLTPVPYLRRAYTLDQPVVRARAYVTALGVYEFYINGTRVGDDCLAPGWTDYRQRVQYQTFDITSLLTTGENAVCLLLGDGWYAGYLCWVGRNYYGNYPLACCQLELTYADGSTVTLGSDGQWKAATGAICSADMLMGERHDARAEIIGWQQPGFDDQTWMPVCVETPDVTRDAQRGPSVRVVDELPALTVTEIAPGCAIFDLGQNMVGWARLRLSGTAGTTVRLRFAEMLNPDGTLYTVNLRNAQCTDYYTLSGAGEEVFAPHFTFRGFRYVELTGYTGPLAPAMITGVVISSATPPTGAFTSGHPMIDQLYRNIQWGQRGNFLSIPTDCPQRDERLGWTGDAQIFVRTAAYNADVAGFFNKWLLDLNDAQLHDGAYPDVAPRTMDGGGNAAWGDAGVICPWTIYQMYGDTRVLADHYSGMKRWIAYCESHSVNLIRPNDGYGDWLSIDADTPKELLGTAYFAYSTSLMAQIADVLGKTSDAAAYRKLFTRIATAFNEKFVAAHGRLTGDTQTAYVLALRFHLLPEEKQLAAARYLVDDIAAKGDHLSTGFLGVGYLLPTLTLAGYPDIAYRLLLNDTFPSWGYSIKQGATTIWERWDGYTEAKGFQDPNMNSFNHYSLGSVGEWLYTTVAGIGLDPAIPAFKHSIIHPQPGGGLTSVSGSLATPYGRIETHWEIVGDRFTLDVTIPANTSATVYLPSTELGEIMESGHPAARAAGVIYQRMDGDETIYRIAAGAYHFSSPAPRWHGDDIAEIDLLFDVDLGK